MGARRGDGAVNGDWGQGGQWGVLGQQMKDRFGEQRAGDGGTRDFDFATPWMQAGKWGDMGGGGAWGGWGGYLSGIKPDATIPAVTPPVTDPVTPPVTDPVTPPVTDPVTPPVTDPVTPPVTPPASNLVPSQGYGSLGTFLRNAFGTNIDTSVAPQSLFGDYGQQAQPVQEPYRPAIGGDYLPYRPPPVEQGRPPEQPYLENWERPWDRPPVPPYVAPKPVVSPVAPKPVVTAPKPVVAPAAPRATLPTSMPPPRTVTQQQLHPGPAVPTAPRTTLVNPGRPRQVTPLPAKKKK